MIRAGLAAACRYLLWRVRSLWHRPPSAIHLPGLTHAVEILYDRFGVPHIRARDAGDAYAAQGYVTAEARLFQLDLVRRTAAGRLAEIFGRRALVGDRFQRRLGLEHLARAKEPQLEEGARSRLAAYTAGVNAFIALGRWPAEYAILGVAPEPWTIADSLAVAELRAVVNASWRADLVRLEVLARVGGERAAALFPELTLPDAGTPAAMPGCFDAALLDRIHDLVAESEEGARLLGLHHADTGTNAWVVGGGLTSTGLPLVANDPHMGFVVPNMNFLVHLSAPDLDVRGLSFPGVPGVVAGHNREIAWGGSALMADTQDVYIEELDEPGGAYRFGDRWLRCEQRREEIRVRGGAPEIVEVTATRHGPLVESRGRWGLALRWERLDQPPGDPSMHAVNTAGDWDSFRDALRGYTGPAIDFVFADRKGNIGYQAAARIPIRARGDGSLPVPGGDGRHEWCGYLSFDQLPFDYRPRCGFVVRGNQNHLPADYPYRLSARWHPRYRAARAKALIAADAGRHCADTLLSAQCDRVSLPSMFLKERLDGAQVAEGAGAVAGAAWDIVHDWDGALAPASAAATIVKEFAAVLKEAILGPHLGKRLMLTYQALWPASSEAIEAILTAEDPQWLPPGTDSYGALYRRCFSDALEHLRRAFGTSEVGRWRWGSRHPVRFSHPLERLPLVGRRFRAPRAAVGSDGECIFAARSVGDYISGQQKVMSGEPNSAAAIFGTAARLVLDVADWDNSVLLLNLGQSADPRDPHFSDHFAAWADGSAIRPPFSAGAVAEACERRVILAPGTRP